MSGTEYRHRRKHLVRVLLRWYSQQGRTLPWRGIKNPYRILVSEVMLQQTQVSRVLVKYREFLRRFPTLKKLAAARRREVIVAWRGMGYNNRAVHLHQLATEVVQRWQGRLPRTFAELVELPGIGRYTANALLSSAFREDVPIVDVNVRRVLSRIFYRMKTTDEMKPEPEIWQLAGTLVPRNRTYDWNQALMDLGATLCTARAPKCPDCPASELCRSRRSMKRAVPAPAQREPSRNGIPNRIYRGRIVETLRKHHRRRLHPDDIGKAIHPQYSARSKKWLGLLLDGLERDGLIVLTENAKHNDRMVALA